MDRNFARALKLVLDSEGGWSDNPHDNGGATMKGITIATFRRYVDKTATKDDLRHITDAQVASIYRRQYWDAVKGDDLPDGVDYAVFDFAVNSGPGRAAKYLQSVVGAKQDGAIGPDTLAKTKGMIRASVINSLCDKRMAFLRRLKDWNIFGRGWTSRVSSVRAEALKMAAGKSTSAPKPSPAQRSQPDAPKPAPQATPAASYREKNVFFRLIYWLLGLIFKVEK